MFSHTPLMCPTIVRPCSLKLEIWMTQAPTLSLRLLVLKSPKTETFGNAAGPILV
uniref:Uncharacterized protein n=1 Tax=Seriola dumerili TaxID=41447 RepID=A0A3B4V571_SERDU